MALTAGQRLGLYEVVSALGAGGMGEVYRARDTKLQRDVAIKVLPESLAADRDRFLMVKEAGGDRKDASSATITVVLNWVEELKAKLPAD